MTIYDAYRIIGVTRSDTEDNIKKAYKKLMIRYHPDNCNGDDSKAKEITEAYNILCKSNESINTTRYVYFDELCRKIKENDTEFVHGMNAENTFVRFIIYVKTEHGNYKSTLDRRYNKYYYNLEFEIEVENTNDSTIDIRIGEFNGKVSMCSKVTSIEIRLCNIRIELSITRKLKAK